MHMMASPWRGARAWRHGSGKLKMRLERKGSDWYKVQFLCRSRPSAKALRYQGTRVFPRYHRMNTSVESRFQNIISYSIPRLECSWHDDYSITASSLPFQVGTSRVLRKPSEKRLMEVNHRYESNQVLCISYPPIIQSRAKCIVYRTRTNKV